MRHTHGVDGDISREAAKLLRSIIAAVAKGELEARTLTLVPCSADLRGRSSRPRYRLPRASPNTYMFGFMQTEDFL